MTQEQKALAKARLKEMLNRAMQACDKANSWGTISVEMQAEIRKYCSEEINWKDQLRVFVKCSRRAEKTNTVKRINKRFPMIFPGRKVSRTANIAIGIDESGSVSDELLGQFFGELNSLSKYATFTVIPFDCEIFEKEIYVWKKGEHKKTERVLSGGTDFQKVTDYVNKVGGFDGLIVATDLCAPAPGPCKVKRVWMTNAESAAQPYMQVSGETVIVLRKGFEENN